MRAVVRQHIQSLNEQGFDPGEIMDVYVLDQSDTAGTLQSVIGFSPLVNRHTGVRFDSEGFTPYWEQFIQHDGWFELVCVLSDDGVGCVVLIPRNAQDTNLLSMCQQYAMRE